MNLVVGLPWKNMICVILWSMYKVLVRDWKRRSQRRDWRTGDVVISKACISLWVIKEDEKVLGEKFFIIEELHTCNVISQGVYLDRENREREKVVAYWMICLFLPLFFCDMHYEASKISHVRWWPLAQNNKVEILAIEYFEKRNTFTYMNIHIHT